MATEKLAVWMDGFEVPAGRLSQNSDQVMNFSYSDDYIQAGGTPLSLALPLTDDEYGDVQTRSFFANLLPENAQMQRFLDREGIDRDDIVALLMHFGADCAGAVSCLPIDAPPVKVPGDLSTDYEPLTDVELANIVRSLAELRRLPADVRDPSPVAGVQSKIALTLLPDKRFAVPKMGLKVPSTHILKVPERRSGRDAKLEENAALLASAVGLDVSIPSAIKVGDYDALLVERFDRKVSNGIVTRIHQEDFAQALSFPSELKYQRNGKELRRFDAEAAISVLDRTLDPAGARLAFLMATLFNLCIGNTDNHAKNHALLYDEGPIPRLAPLYDLMPIRLSNDYTHELSFNLGNANFFDTMTPGDLGVFLTSCGVDDIIEFVEQAFVPMVKSLEAVTPNLRSAGLRRFDDLIGRETDRLVGLLEAAVELRERDAFLDKGGGWQMIS